VRNSEVGGAPGCNTGGLWNNVFSGVEGAPKPVFRGLAVEHYQKNEVIWSGQGGTDIFYQNELPYDPPSQADWMASPTQDGYPAFLVTKNAKTFQGCGLSSRVHRHLGDLVRRRSFPGTRYPGCAVPQHLRGWIAGSGDYNSIINGVGDPVNSTNPGTVKPVDLTSYP
jgi:hypothetical protein